MPAPSRLFNNQSLRTNSINTSPPDILDDIEDIDNSPSPPDILDDETNESPQNLSVVNPEEPGSFSEGFANSILSGEALNTGLKSLKGYAKGATLDIPKSIMDIPGALKTGYDLINPSQWYDHNPIDTLKSIGSGLKGMYDTTMRSGAYPEEFGRMMGQITGQPLVTAGIAKGAPGAIRTAGIPIEGAGRIMKRYQPISGVLPRLAEGRTLRNIERGIGSGVESIGQKMRGVGKSPNVLNGEMADIPESSYSYRDIPRKELPPSDTSYYGPETNPNAPIITPEPRVPKQIAPSKVPQYMEPTTPPRKMTVISNNASEAMNEVRNSKRNLKANPDGTFTDLKTGELIDSSGNSIIKIDNKPVKPLTKAELNELKNSAMFNRNRYPEF